MTPVNRKLTVKEDVVAMLAHLDHAGIPKKGWEDISCFIECRAATPLLTQHVPGWYTGFISRKFVQSCPKPLNINFLYFRLQTMLARSRSTGSNWSRAWAKPRSSWKSKRVNQDLAVLKETPCDEERYSGWGFGAEFLIGMASIGEGIWWLRFSSSIIPVFSYLLLEIVILFSNQLSSWSFLHSSSGEIMDLFMLLLLWTSPG